MSDTDEAAPDPDQTLASTQPPSQPSQSEQNNPPLPEKHWGCLIPISDYTSISASSVPRETIYFKLERPTETVGRSVDNCSIPLTHHANDISRLHARIHWDGVRGRSSLCTIIHLSDASTTFLNRAPLNKGQVYCLAHGDMVAFGGSSQERAYHRFSFAFLAKDNQSAPFEIDYDFNASTNKVGEGGYAEVYKGVHRNTGDFVAIKMIRKPDVPLQPSDLTNPHSPIEKLIQLTRKEVRAMRRLNHLNVTKLLAEYWEESLLQTRFIGYLVLEYVDGNTLLRYINDNGNGGLTEAQTMALMWQMLNGTAYLHSRRIIHRDLKPENILLTSDPNPVVKLADFGLARILSSSELNVHTPCGSPDYVAPEVLREGDPGSKKPTYDAKADAFSIGIILYVMLFAKLPYTSYGSAGKANLAQLVQRRTIEWSSFADRGSSDDVRSLFKVMVRKDPQGRLSVHEALDHRWFAVRHYILLLRAKAHAQ
ncbi:kinase-like domain-containing protein [Flagelloscypha sp. PMI_526]|nr:kinase-like domain-containing protein [Flagelloscypha sp. PMI_526]